MKNNINIDFDAKNIFKGIFYLCKRLTKFKIKGVFYMSSINKMNELLSGEWKIVTKLDQNKCLDISGSARNVVINDKGNSNAQRWTFQFDSDKRAFIILNKNHAGYFLTDNSGNATLEDQGENYYSTLLQRWHLHQQEDGSFIIANYPGNYLNPSVLDLTGSNTTNGTKLLSHQHSGNDNQRFYIIKA